MKNKKLQIRNSTAEFLVFTKQAGQNSIEVRVENETVWLTQKLIANLFDINVRTISEHFKNIFKSNELDKNSVVRKFRITASNGKNYNTQFYNLDAIISVGYRVNSVRATQFRQWATKLNAFLQFNEKELLTDAGKVSHAIAKTFAENEFEKYRIRQDAMFQSDFDKLIDKMDNKQINEKD